MKDVNRCLCGHLTADHHYQPEGDFIRCEPDEEIVCFCAEFTSEASEPEWNSENEWNPSELFEPEFSNFEFAPETEATPETAHGKAFVIDRSAPPETKSKDNIEIRFSKKLSVEHFSFEWCEAAAGYTATNRAEKGSGNTYEVYFFRSRNGAAVLGGCNCAARIMCKHISRCWAVHTTAEGAGFLPEI